MISFLKKLWRNKRGNTLAIAAASMPLFIGAAGLATDTIQWTLWKRQLQRAADSAAIAGVYDRQLALGATSNTPTAVSRDLNNDLHTFYSLTTGHANCSGTCTISYPADSGVMTDQVSVTISIQKPLAFSSFFLSTAPTITASATAASIPWGGDACIESLDTSTSTGITFSGNAAVVMPDCDIFANSAGSNSAVGKGSSSVTAHTVGGVGGVQQSSNFTVTAYRPYSPPLADPFASVTPDPSQMNCTASALTEATNFSSLPAGTNCFSSLSVKSNKTLTIPNNFGPIYINGGSVSLHGDFSCTGCTIVMTNNNPTSNTIGTISVNAGSNNNITAPTSGTYKGIAIYQDRRASTCTGNCNNINGNSGSIITGAIYLPKQEVYYNGSGNVTATCTMFVSYRVTFTGNSATSNKFKDLTDCSAEGLPGNSTQQMVRLVA